MFGAFRRWSSRFSLFSLPPSPAAAGDGWRVEVGGSVGSGEGLPSLSFLLPPCYICLYIFGVVCGIWLRALICLVSDVEFRCHPSLIAGSCGCESCGSTRHFNNHPLIDKSDLGLHNIIHLFYFGYIALVCHL